MCIILAADHKAWTSSARRSSPSHSAGQLSGDAGLLPIRQFQLIADRSPDGNDLVRPRRFSAKPSPPPAPQVKMAHAASQPGAQLLPAPQRHFRLLWQRDPLGRGRSCIWCTLLLKVAAEVVVSTRRILVRLSSNWTHLCWYRRVCERLSGPLLTPVPHPFG
jgi:hypothetical protein